MRSYDVYRTGYGEVVYYCMYLQSRWRCKVFVSRGETEDRGCYGPRAFVTLLVEGIGHMPEVLSCTSETMMGVMRPNPFFSAPCHTLLADELQHYITYL